MSNALFHLDILVLVFAVSGAVLQPFQSINNQISSTNGSSSLIPIATTNRAETIVQLSNATASAPVNLGALRAQCNARKFGSNLNVPSCRNAFAHIFPNDTNFSFGMRHDGRQYDTKLPFQWLSVDALCSFNLFLVAPATVAHANLADIKSAAQALLDTCTATSPARGGVASNIGGDNRLAVVMRSESHPNVRCEPAPIDPPPVETRRQWMHWCNGIVAGIPATTASQVFGPLDPSVAVVLPQAYHSRGDRCLVYVTDNGSPDQISWYELWEELNVVWSLCLATGKVGRSVGLGVHGNIELRLVLHLD